MTLKMNERGVMEIEFLSRDDLNRLIYMTNDIWITPELKQFKRNILKRLDETDETES